MGAWRFCGVPYKPAGRGACAGGPTRRLEAELLALRESVGHVFAENSDPDLFPDRRLPVWGAYSGPSDWWVAAPSGMQIAVCRGLDVARGGFSLRGAVAGVTVNVIDKPAWCDFQFGSIVNRSPAVIAISTDGAAPILGQAIRRRIETLLPPSLAKWAQLAHTIPLGGQSAAGAPGGSRRAFWESFVRPGRSARKADREQPRASCLLAPMRWVRSHASPAGSRFHARRRRFAGDPEL